MLNFTINIILKLRENSNYNINIYNIYKIYYKNIRILNNNYLNIIYNKIIF